MEIKPQDLRVGNLFHREDGTGVLIDALAIVEASQRQVANGRTGLKGIELTPEWLERFGFKWRNENRGEGSILDFKTSEDPRDWKKNMSVAIEFKANGGGIAVLSVTRNYHYVHQLQNLYFSLTAEELAIDKTSLKN